jgi:hypothetical protein
MPIRAGWKGFIYLGRNQLEDALEASVETVQVKGYTVNIPVISRTLSLLPDIEATLDHVLKLVDVLVNTRTQRPMAARHNSTP